MTLARWIVCQIGAREHYVLAGELHRRGRLAALCTDLWVRPGTALHGLGRGAGRLGQQFGGRYSPALAGAWVETQPIAQVFAQRLRRRRPWQQILAANRAFGEHMAAALQADGLLRPQADGGRPVVFAYSYAALPILRAAREAGCVTMLGQIDPGPHEDRLVADLESRHGFPSQNEHPPEAYWSDWREECALADRIVVNSAWSRRGLIEAGIAADKLRVVPLAYEPGHAAGAKSYPRAFSAERSLKALFLGQVGLRKGAVELLQAMERLAGEPVELTLVGPVAAKLRERFGGLKNVVWAGPAARDEVARHYAGADLFVLPTHSDGFALTQLEAAARGLPLLVSDRCGQVVENGVNGLIVPAVTPGAIEAALREALDPRLLAAMAAHARDPLASFTAGRVVDQLVAIAEEVP